MAIHTIDNLQDRLDDSLAWRRTELVEMRRQISLASRASRESPASRVLSRCAVALLYAHWEGFFHDACSGYVEMLKRRKPKLTDLNDGLMLSALRRVLQNALGGDREAKRELVDLLRREGTPRKQLPRDLINTKSNLRYDVACEILEALGLEPGLFATKQPLIDKSLCDVRNNVAHGKREFPSVDDYESLMHEVLTMMEQLRDHLLGSVRAERFLAPSARTPVL